MSKYPIGDSYRALYQSVRDDALKNGEIIFMKAYDKDNFKHSTVSYTCSSTKLSGITKDAFDAYLFKDGKPLALTSENKSDLPEYNEKGEYSIEKLLAVRDGRLAETTDPVVFYQDMTWSRAGAMAMTSSTGYGVSKFDNTSLPLDDRQNTVKNYTTAPLYWGALICLNYAEAKAELGTLTDADMALTLNKLYKRAGLPDQTVASLEAMNDPANNGRPFNINYLLLFIYSKEDSEKQQSLSMQSGLQGLGTDIGEPQTDECVRMSRLHSCRSCLV